MEPRMTWTYITDPMDPFFGYVRTHTIGNTNAPAGLAAGGTCQYSYTNLPAPPSIDLNIPTMQTTVIGPARNRDGLPFQSVGPYHQRGDPGARAARRALPELQQKLFL